MPCASLVPSQDGVFVPIINDPRKFTIDGCYKPSPNAMVYGIGFTTLYNSVFTLNQSLSNRLATIIPFFRHYSSLGLPYGGFLKWRYPYIIHFNGIFPYKLHHPFWDSPIYEQTHRDFEPHRNGPYGHEFIALGSGQRRRFMAKYSRTVR